MNINAISFEPNSSYIAEGKNSLIGGASMTCRNIAIETDQIGRVQKFSDGFSTDRSMADTYDYAKIRNVRTGKIWDLRLHTAALNGSTQLAGEALAEGADVTLRMKQRATALHWAAAKGHEDVTKLLVEHGADVNAVDDLGWRPAFLAYKGGYVTLVKYLVQKGAETIAIIGGKEVSLPTMEGNPEEDLIEAAEDGDFNAAKSAIDANADVNHRFQDGWTPLLSASKGHPEIVQLLLANGADPNLASDRGYTPLMRAAGNGNEAIVRLLIAAGADRLMVDCDGKSAHRLAMEMGQQRCAEMVR
jgi:ankyrin repeat protein